MQAALKQQRKNVSRSGEYLTLVRQYVEKVRASSEPPGLERSLKDLKIRQLEREMETGTDTLTVQAVHRLLSYAFLVLAWYESSLAFEQNNPARALGLLDVADAIQPVSAGVCARRKRAMGMMGRDTSEAAEPCPATR